MKPKDFAQPSWIAFQGDRVLRLLHQNADYAQFELIGFENKVALFDYRPKTLKVLEGILAHREKVNAFPLAFNTPAFVHIKDLQSSSLEIRLTETDNPQPLFMLWAAIGLEDGVPIYDYVATRYAPLDPLDETKIAFFSIYRRPQPIKQPHIVVPSVQKPERYSLSDELSGIAVSLD